MPRKPLIRSSHCIYHVTNRSNNKEWFYTPIEEVWEIATKFLTISCERYQVIPYAFVLMSNHYHLLLSTPLRNLDAMMRYFQTEIAKAIQRKAERINHIFGTRYKPTCLWNASAVAFGYKYVLRNPVRCGIAECVEEYLYSSAHSHALFKAPWVNGILELWGFVPKKPAERLNWLNLPSQKEVEELIGKGLRRSEFKFSQGHEYVERLRLLEEEYRIPTAPATFSTEKSMGTRKPEISENRRKVGRLWFE